MSSAGDDDTVASSLLGSAAGDTMRTEMPELVAGRYRIVRWLGSGGMGRVYEALDGELGEKVALKALRGGLTEEAIARFRREVKLTRRIVHPNIARMFDIGEHAGDRFLTMELIDGDALTRELGPPMVWARLQHLAVQICDGLAAAHRAGVIHRDLKPDNVLVERVTDRVVITDFGIARSIDESNVTQIGTLIGTPRYMAPEQLAGEQVDARADLFALGVMLYEMATGVRPWSGDHAIAIAVSQATQPARPIGDIKVPAQFVAILEQCLALDREQRPASAEIVRDAIAASAGLPQRPTPVPLKAAPRARSDDTTIAVLPFVCAEADAYLADGIAEDLVDTLSGTARLRVRPAGVGRTAAGVDPRAVGQDLAVDHVVVGSVRRTPRGLRVSARLIGVADGFQIWAHRVDAGEADALAVSDQLAAGIAQALSTRASTVTRPLDPRAVDLYLRARAELRRFWGEHALNAADLLDQAAVIAPSSDAVLGALAFARVQAWIRVGDPALLPLARTAVARAMVTGHGEAQLAQGLLDLNVGAYESAARHLGQALARTPMSSQIHEACARLLVEIGGVQEGRHHFTTALGLDAGRINMINVDLARLEALEGNLPRCDALLESVLADPDPAVIQVGAMFAGRIAAWFGDLAKMERAIATLHTRLMIAALPEKYGAISQTMIDFYRRWKQGGGFDAQAFARLVAFDPVQPHRNQIIMLQRLAETAMLMGQRPSALLALQQAAEAGLIDIFYLDRCPLLAGLVDEPPWRAIRDMVEHRAATTLAAFRAAAG